LRFKNIALFASVVTSPKVPVGNNNSRRIARNSARVRR